MLKMKLQRVGRRHDPSFRVIVTDSTKSPQSGKSVEILGSYDSKEKHINLNTERASYWLSCGAQPTDTVHNLLVKQQVIKGPKVDVSSKKNVGGEQRGEAGEAASSDVESAAKIVEEEAASAEGAKEKEPSQQQEETGGEESPEAQQEESSEAADAQQDESPEAGEESSEEGASSESSEEENSEENYSQEKETT